MSILPPKTKNNILSEKYLENVLQNIGAKIDKSYFIDAYQVISKNNKEYINITVYKMLYYYFTIFFF